MKTRVTVTLKSGVLDPQGKAIEGALKSLGDRRRRQGAAGQGVRHRARRRRRAGRRARRSTEACEKLLANTIVEDYAIDYRLSPCAPRCRVSRLQSRRRRRARRLTPGDRRAAPAIVWHADSALPREPDLVVLPGGFSYGDYLRCGAIAARTRVMDAVAAHAERGGLVLGICNGFQILCEAGLLPGVLMRNAHRRFVCKMQHLRVENARPRSPRRYAPGQVVKVAIAHGEGNFIIDAAGLAESTRRTRRVPLLRRAGRVGGDANPNGSMNAIAGVYNERFNVLGLMPHPRTSSTRWSAASTAARMFAGLAANSARTRLDLASMATQRCEDRTRRHE